MKALLRGFLINLAALYSTSFILPGFFYQGGFRTLAIGAIVFMCINFLIVPLLKVMFLPLNLLTLGFFSWAVNVLALYFLTTLVPQFKIIPFYFSGYHYNGFVIPGFDLNTLYVAIIASFMIGLITHLIYWLIK